MADRAFVALDGALDPDAWFDRHGLGVSVHKGKGYLQGVVQTTNPGVVSQTILPAGSIPVNYRPPSPASVSLWPWISDTDGATRDEGVEPDFLHMAYPATVGADGSLVLDSALPAGVVAGDYDFALNLSYGEWTIATQTDSPSWVTLPVNTSLFANVDAEYALHGNRAHFRGAVTALTDASLDTSKIATLPAPASYPAEAGDPDGNPSSEATITASTWFGATGAMVQGDDLYLFDHDQTGTSTQHDVVIASARPAETDDQPFRHPGGLEVRDEQSTVLATIAPDQELVPCDVANPITGDPEPADPSPPTGIPFPSTGAVAVGAAVAAMDPEPDWVAIYFELAGVISRDYWISNGGWCERKTGINLLPGYTLSSGTVEFEEYLEYPPGLGFQEPDWRNPYALQVTGMVVPPAPLYERRGMVDTLDFARLVWDMDAVAGLTFEWNPDVLMGSHDPMGSRVEIDARFILVPFFETRDLTIITGDEIELSGGYALATPAGGWVNVV